MKQQRSHTLGPVCRGFLRSAALEAALAGFLLVGLAACADSTLTGAAGQPTSAITASSPAQAITQTGPAPTTNVAVVTATLAPSAMPAVQVSPTLAAVGASGTTSPTQALQTNLALADREMNAARTSASLAAAQQHAQMVINLYVGAWGRWFSASQVVAPGGGQGIFPGERIPGPAPDSGAVLPIGWGIRAYEMGDPPTQQAVQSIMGDAMRWSNDPRAGYDQIAAAVTSADVNGSQIDRLPGTGERAVAWARLILVKANSVEQAQQYAGLGSQATGAALAAVQGLRP